MKVSCFKCWKRKTKLVAKQPRGLSLQLRVKKDCQYVNSHEILDIVNEQMYDMFQFLIKEGSDPNPAFSSLT